MDRSEHDIPAGVILKTDLGEREINVVWLAAEGGEGRPDGGQALRPDRRRVRGAIDTAKLKAERVALLAKTLGCEAVKAGQMADKLSGLTDDAFEAHVGYLAQQLAVYRQAARRT